MTAGAMMSSGIPAPLFTPLILRDTHARLDSAAAPAAGRTVLMCSPAGSGKTVLAAEWLRRHLHGHPKTRYCWITVTETMDDAARLWTEIRAQLGLPTDGARQSTDPMGAVIDLVQDAAERPAVVVLDDAHLLTDPLALAGLEYFLHYAPAPMLTIVTGRYEPPLRWHSLDMAGRLVRLGPTDLAFDAEHIASVFVEHGCPLDEDELASIHHLTRGWAALVRIAALYTAMHGPERGTALAMLAHAPHPISDFLVGELIEVLDDDVRDFLLATCVPESFTDALAEELAGPRTPRVLDDLARINFPVQHTVHEDRLRYSYHPMLRAYLLAELQRATPQRIAELHRRSGRWYLTVGDPTAALPHLLAEPGQPQLSSYIREYGLRMVLEGTGPILFHKLDAATARLLDDPFVVLLRVIDAVERGDNAAAAAYLDQFAARDPAGSAVVTATWLAAMRLAATAAVEVAIGVGGEGSPENRATLPISADPPTTGQTDLDCYLAIQLGSARLCAGSVIAGEQALHRALALAEHTGNHRLQLRAVTRLAAASALTGPIPLMRDRATRAIDLALAHDLTRQPDHVHAIALRALADYLQGEPVEPEDLAGLAQTRRGLDGANEPVAGRHAYIVGLLLGFDAAADKYAAAMRLHGQMQRLLGETPRPPIDGRLLVPVVSILLRLHERDLAAQLAATAHRTLHGAPDAVLACAAVAEAMNKPQDILDAVQPLLDRAAALPAYSAVTAWLLYACAAHRLDRPVKSYEGLAEAVRLAAPDRLVRPFFEVAGALTLLHDHAGRFGTGNVFVETVREYAAARPQPMTPALTDAELTVLRQLPSGRTALQIAQDLGVSINTVKTHLRAVYAKLGANSRAEAMLRARRIGLL
ncbi:LuxR C-terminal-related transcriptional regulator [Nocardia arizonensis]|uniref:LuxR C-terminal-related transcriptional regulator n=1 Tax=Nocardia arizonensis TaxID=1141647 RepID=UPI0006CF665D|nr:LuxR C-terminal-related transcriptional regulator [Nocardia arizonensis]